MAIIGISGYAGSGKDTVAKVIQYCMSPCSDPNGGRYRTYQQFLNMNGGSEPRNFDHHYQTDWEIKKFAGKLKEITCLLTGVSMSDLEDQQFKQRPLDPMWDRIYINQYDKRTQKNLQIGPYSTWSEADVYRTELRNSLRRKGLQDDVELSIVKRGFIVRDFLQILGTDALRDKLHNEVWINALFSDYTGIHTDHVPGGFEYPNWIISDCRFPNEARAIKDRGGVIIRILRPDNTPVNRHDSEIALDGWDFDDTIYNDGTIEELIPKVKKMLEDQSIIV